MIKLSPPPGTGPWVTNAWKQPWRQYDSNDKPIIPTRRLVDVKKEKPPRNSKPPFIVIRPHTPTIPPSPSLQEIVSVKKEQISHCKISESDIENKTPQKISALILEKYEAEINVGRTIENEQPLVTLLENIAKNIKVDPTHFNGMKPWFVKIGINSQLAKKIIGRLQEASSNISSSIPNNIPKSENPLEKVLHALGQIKKTPFNLLERRKINDFLEDISFNIAHEKCDFLKACYEQNMNLEKVNLNQEFECYKVYRDYLLRPQYAQFANLANGLCSAFKENTFNSFSKRLEVINFLDQTKQDVCSVNFLYNLTTLKQEHDVKGVDNLFTNAYNGFKSGYRMSGIYFESEIALNLIYKRFKVLSVSDNQLTRQRGDIDIVAKYGNATYYIEVKSSYEAVAGHDSQYGKLIKLARGRQAIPVLLIPDRAIKEILGHVAAVPIEMKRFLKFPSAQVWNESGGNISDEMRNLFNLVQI